MAAVLDILTRSLRLIGVLAEGTTPNAGQSTDGIAALDAMLATWEAEGAPLTVRPLVPTTVLALPAAHTDAAVYGLAVRIAPEYGAEATGTVQRIADERLRRLSADYWPRPETLPDIEYRRPRSWGVPYGGWS